MGWASGWPTSEGANEPLLSPSRWISENRVRLSPVSSSSPFGTKWSVSDFYHSRQSDSPFSFSMRSEVVFVGSSIGSRRFHMSIEPFFTMNTCFIRRLSRAITSDSLQWSIMNEEHSKENTSERTRNADAEYRWECHWDGRSGNRVRMGSHFYREECESKDRSFLFDLLQISQICSTTVSVFCPKDSLKVLSITTADGIEWFQTRHLHPSTSRTIPVLFWTWPWNFDWNSPVDFYPRSTSHSCRAAPTIYVPQMSIRVPAHPTLPHY